MGRGTAWVRMGHWRREPLISDLSRGLEETGRWTTASCQNPGTEALDSAEEMERTAVRALAQREVSDKPLGTLLRRSDLSLRVTFLFDLFFYPDLVFQQPP